mgnify:CR=1 FL=1
MFVPPWITFLIAAAVIAFGLYRIYIAVTTDKEHDEVQEALLELTGPWYWGPRPYTLTIRGDEAGAAHNDLINIRLNASDPNWVPPLKHDVFCEGGFARQAGLFVLTNRDLFRVKLFPVALFVFAPYFHAAFPVCRQGIHRKFVIVKRQFEGD